MNDPAPTALETVRAWFACFADADIERARRLLAPGAPIRVFAAGAEPVELQGFDEFVAWYEKRRRTMQDFEYHVDELLGGRDHAVALITLTHDRAESRQVAVYRVDQGVIVEIRAYEEPD